MKRLLLAAVALSLCAQAANAAPAQITARPYNQYGQPMDPQFTVCVLTDATACTVAVESPYPFEVAASDNHQVIKNGAGKLSSFDAWSKHSVALYLRFYNAGTGFNGCNSATNLIWEGEIPANSTPANGAGLVRAGINITFTTGLAVCVTGAYGNTDTTAATASVASVNVVYQ